MDDDDVGKKQENIQMHMDGGGEEEDVVVDTEAEDDADVAYLEKQMLPLLQ